MITSPQFDREGQADMNSLNFMGFPFILNSFRLYGLLLQVNAHLRISWVSRQPCVVGHKIPMMILTGVVILVAPLAIEQDLPLTTPTELIKVGIQVYNISTQSYNSVARE